MWRPPSKLTLIALAVAAISLLFPLPLAELGLSIASALASRGVRGVLGVLLTALAIYLGLRGLMNMFILGAPWAVEPLPLLASGAFLAKEWEKRGSIYIRAASRALALAAVFFFTTAPFLPDFIRALWLPASLWALGSSLRPIGGSYEVGGIALEGIAALLALSYLLKPVSAEASNDIFYLAFLVVPPLALLRAGEEEGEEYIPTPRLAWASEEDEAIKGAVEAYLRKGDASKLIAVLAYSYASAGLPLDVVLKTVEELKTARRRKDREIALKAALSRLGERS